MKECIDDRFKEGDPEFSQEFENYVRGTLDPVLTRKIRISKEGPGVISLSEFQAFDASGVNIVINKPSSQSSTDGAFTADRGNNGDVNDFSQTDPLGDGELILILFVHVVT